MREYLYMWINECVLLDDFGGAGYMIYEQGFSLSSKYRIKNVLNNKTLFFKCEPTSVPNNFFSSDFSDIKVFVGENGSGKSTALKILYKIIGEGFDNPIDDVNGFLIFYTDDGEHIYYYKSPECPYAIDAPFATEVFEKYGVLPYKSARTIFYTAAVNDVEVKLRGARNCYDISTNALLYSDCENRYNDPMLSKDYFSTYVVMEMIRKIKFSTIFYNQFTNNDSVKFRIPNAIRVSPIKIDQYIIEKISDDPLIREEWLHLERSIDNFDDYFRLAILCNHIKGMSREIREKGYVPVIVDNPKKIGEMGLSEALREYSENNIIVGERGLSNRVERLLSVVNITFEEQQKAINEYRKIRPTLKASEGIFFDLNNPKHRKILRIFIEGSRKITLLTPFFTMKWRPQSSGEEAFIKFYSRFYDVLKNYREVPEVKDIHLFIDEADVYLHPEWQRCWMNEFVGMMKIILKRMYLSNTPKIQMFISTHSPFMITDFPKENLVLLKKKDKRASVEVLNEPEISPFGANLYDLLSDSFFLKENIGLFSKRKIQGLIGNKRRKKYYMENVDLRMDEKEQKYVESRIGDPVVRSLIKNMVEKNDTIG